MTDMRVSVVPTVAKRSGDSGYGVWTFRGMSAVLLFGRVVWYNPSVEGGGDRLQADDLIFDIGRIGKKSRSRELKSKIGG